MNTVQELILLRVQKTFSFTGHWVSYGCIASIKVGGIFWWIKYFLFSISFYGMEYKILTNCVHSPTSKQNLASTPQRLTLNNQVLLYWYYYIDSYIIYTFYNRHSKMLIVMWGESPNVNLPLDVAKSHTLYLKQWNKYYHLSCKEMPFPWKTSHSCLV